MLQYENLLIYMYIRKFWICLLFHASFRSISEKHLKVHSLGKGVCLFFFARPPPPHPAPVLITPQQFDDLLYWPVRISYLLVLESSAFRVLVVLAAMN